MKAKLVYSLRNEEWLLYEDNKRAIRFNLFALYRFNKNGSSRVKTFYEPRYMKYFNDNKAPAWRPFQFN